jgi:hypothetical protein
VNRQSRQRRGFPLQWQGAVDRPRRRPCCYAPTRASRGRFHGLLVGNQHARTRTPLLLGLTRHGCACEARCGRADCEALVALSRDSRPGSACPPEPVAHTTSLRTAWSPGFRGGPARSAATSAAEPARRGRTSQSTLRRMPSRIIRRDRLFDQPQWLIDGTPGMQGGVAQSGTAIHGGG